MRDMPRLSVLKRVVRELYTQKGKDLVFHGWRHIQFVFKKSQEFAADLGADQFLVQSAALLHDINYFTGQNSDPRVGANLRKSILDECGYSEHEINRIEEIIIESHTAFRNEIISTEGQALSDADSLFKVLPITPVLLAQKYMIENDVTIEVLARKIVSEQNKLMNAGIYFYSPIAIKRYQEWAKVNLELWNYIIESIDDPAIKELILNEDLDSQ